MLSKSYIRTAGWLYIVIAVAGGFSIGYVPSVMSAATLAENTALYRLGLLGDIIVLLCELALTVMLYRIFKPVSETLALIATYARFAMVGVMAINILLGVLPLYVISLSTPMPEMVLALFEAKQIGVYVWQLFFSLHLLAIGAMILRSGLFPRLLGWMMGIGAFGYLLEGLSKLTYFENAALSWAIIGLLVVVTLGELAFAIWLIAKGQVRA
ncbi:MAG: DUF4386 family protein [Rhodobacteraceae bacterium]|nr:DUF4386 family protein [Paracoccaceae bacterium]